MKQNATKAVPNSIDATLKLLGEANYLADRSLSRLLRDDWPRSIDDL